MTNGKDFRVLLL